MFNQQTLIQPLQAPNETSSPFPVTVEIGMEANNFTSVSQQLIGDKQQHSGQPPPVWQQQVQHQHSHLPPQHIQNTINMEPMTVMSASQQGPEQVTVELLQSYSGANDLFCPDSAEPATMDPSQFALSDRKVRAPPWTKAKSFLCHLTYFLTAIPHPNRRSAASKAAIRLR